VTAGQALARYRAEGGYVWVEGGRLRHRAPDPLTEDAAAAVEAIRAHREEVRAALADVEAHANRRCCRSVRVWQEADALHADYRVHGGHLDRATYLAALTADGSCWLGPAGLVVGIGLVADWPALDGGGGVGNDTDPNARGPVPAAPTQRPHCDRTGRPLGGGQGYVPHGGPCQRPCAQDGALGCCAICAISAISSRTRLSGCAVSARFLRGFGTRALARANRAETAQGSRARNA